MRDVFLIAGSGGMLGSALCTVLHQRGARFTAPRVSEFDITDEVVVSNVVSVFSESLESGERGVLINAAAYTNVEAAEQDRLNAFRVNETGPSLLAAAAEMHHMRFVHISTDFVFDGNKNSPYTEADEPNPLSVYGSSKLAGERAVARVAPLSLIIRTAWVFATNGANFPLKIVSAARERGALDVVTDETGSPTYAMDLASGVLDLTQADTSGLFHLTGSGECSRHQFALAILAQTGLDSVPVRPVRSNQFPSRVARPLYSVLDCSKAEQAGVRMPRWEDGLLRWAHDLDALGL